MTCFSLSSRSYLLFPLSWIQWDTWKVSSRAQWRLCQHHKESDYEFVQVMVSNFKKKQSCPNPNPKPRKNFLSKIWFSITKIRIVGERDAVPKSCKRGFLFSTHFPKLANAGTADCGAEWLTQRHDLPCHNSYLRNVALMRCCSFSEKKIQNSTTSKYVPH